MRRVETLLVVLLSLALVACEPAGPGRVDLPRLVSAASEPGEWFTGGRDLAQTYHSPLQQIHAENASQVGYAWHYELGTRDGPQATPVVVDGVMYASGPYGKVFALDAKTGQELWRFDPEVPLSWGRFATSGPVNRGVVLFVGKVFVGSLDGRLFALDAGTGAVVWEVDTVVDPDRATNITGSPYLAGDVVVIGNAGGDLDARGYVSAYESDSGELRWRFFIVPGGPEGPFENPELEWAVKTWDPDSLWETGLGGTAWDGMSYDPELNLLYVGTGNGNPYPRRLRSPAGGDNLFLSSILALDPEDGRLVWHYQTTPADNWDYTAVQKTILADLEIDGALRKVIMQAPKNGFFYVLDRKTGDLISAEPYIPLNWASHVDLETGRPVEKEQGHYFDEPKLIFPSPLGGHVWQPMAYNPETGLVYIPAIEMGAVLRLPDAPFSYRPQRGNYFLEIYNPVPGTYGWDAYRLAGLPPFEELAAGQPDPTARSVLRAWDPVAQRQMWEVDTSAHLSGQVQAPYVGGGVLTTAGNLVIQGRTTGGLYFYAADSGELLHVIETDSSLMTAPTTYEVDGVQYLAVLAGLGGSYLRAAPEGTADARYGKRDRILAFALDGGEVPMRPPLPPPPPLAKPTLARPTSPEQVARGASLHLYNCAGCHLGLGVGGPPDLRRMSPDVHASFADIVLRGGRLALGMPNFGGLLSEEDVEDLHAYVIELAWRGWQEGRVRRVRVRGLLSPKQGKTEACLRTVRDQVERTRREDSDTESYEVFEKEEGGGLQILEVHHDSGATLAHLEHSQPLSLGFRENCDFGRVEIFGNPSEPLREIFEVYDAAFYRPLAGFTREPKPDVGQERPGSPIRVNTRLAARGADPEPCRRAVRSLVERVEAQDPGALSYETFESELASDFRILEVHASAEALQSHLTNAAPHLEGFDAVCETLEVEVFGSPSEALRSELEAWRSVMHRPHDGFTR